jgi:hypothetical protein
VVNVNLELLGKVIKGVTELVGVSMLDDECLLWTRWLWSPEERRFASEDGLAYLAYTMWKLETSCMGC